jgi:hypothetical protein
MQLRTDFSDISRRICIAFILSQFPCFKLNIRKKEIGEFYVKLSHDKYGKTFKYTTLMVIVRLPQLTL